MGYLTVKDVASQLNLSERRVRDLLQDGQIQGLRPGRKWLVSPTEVDRYLGKPFREQEYRTERIVYPRDALAAGTEVVVAPALALEIPLVVDKGEAITHIQVNVAKTWTEDYIDCEVFDGAGKGVLEWRRVQNRGVSLHLPMGQYVLRLGNEFQPAVEKIVALNIKWESDTGHGLSGPMDMSDFSNLRAEFR